jgi:hypothetical protein
VILRLGRACSVSIELASKQNKFVSKRNGEKAMGLNRSSCFPIDPTYAHPFTLAPVLNQAAGFLVSFGPASSWFHVASWMFGTWGFVACLGPWRVDRNSRPHSEHLSHHVICIFPL